VTEPEHVVLWEHGGRRILGVRGSDGACEAETFITGLPLKARLDFEKIMSRLTEFGRISNTEFFRRIAAPGQPTVWEMKSHDGPGYRLFCIQDRMDWWATHGRKKPKDKQILNEVNKAREIFAGRSRT
jgi:putative component of toxin-antitoxin plasmid stabilization module